jgi:hypothetical protein
MALLRRYLSFATGRLGFLLSFLSRLWAWWRLRSQKETFRFMHLRRFSKLSGCAWGKAGRPS